MKILSKCEVCKKRKLLIKIRTIKLLVAPYKMKSQSQMCGTCKKNITYMANQQVMNKK